jgi:penicillin-binding protein 1A
MKMRNSSSKRIRFYEAITLTRKYDAEHIFDIYINTIEFGHETCGLSSAAEKFFQKSLDELSITETIVLIVIPEDIDLYSPYNTDLNEEGEYYWRARSEYILGEMLDRKYVNQEEYDRALEELASMEFSKEQ